MQEEESFMFHFMLLPTILNFCTGHISISLSQKVNVGGYEKVHNL